MEDFVLGLSLTSKDQRILFNHIIKRLFAHKGMPDVLSVDHRDRKTSIGWFEKWFDKSKMSIQASWEKSSLDWIEYNHENAIKFHVVFDSSFDAVAELLVDLPFTIAVFNTRYSNWSSEEQKYTAPGFGLKHFPLGWGCAFKGDGHQQLVSRRWLSFGPWRLRRYKGDLSVVQFHELDADAATALSQARPGHQRMGVSETGGYLQQKYVYRHEIEGTYLPDERRLKIAIHDREITAFEMRDAAAVKRYQALGADNPVDSIAYVFMEEERARQYLPELWLYGLECWAFINGVQQRLDTNYHPTPAPPEWAVRLGTDASQGEEAGL